MQLKGFFLPAYYPRIIGFNKQGGEFWIGFLDDERLGTAIRIELTVWADDSPSKNTYASIHVHHDAISVVRELERVGFLALFEELKASTFYDVVQCCVRSDISIMYHGDNVKEMVPRKIYELLYV